VAEKYNKQEDLIWTFVYTFWPLLSQLLWSSLLLCRIIISLLESLTSSNTPYLLCVLSPLLNANLVGGRALCLLGGGAAGSAVNFSSITVPCPFDRNDCKW
jgi:hypothetical protein